jgi:membrane-bound ClpP family serine protease
LSDRAGHGGETFTPERIIMGIGTGIALFVIGAILAFAVNVDLGGVIDLALIGYILMGAGVVVFLISLVLMLRRRQSTATTRTAVDPASGEQVTRSTRDTNDPLV